MKPPSILMAIIIACAMPVHAGAHDDTRAGGEAAREAAERSGEEMRAAHRFWVERLRILREGSKPTLHRPEVPVFRPRGSGD